MTNVLLLLSPSSDAPRSTARAFERALQFGGDLVVLVALPRAAVEELAGTLADEAFVGDKLSEDVLEALRREQLAQAEDLLHRMDEQAKKKGVHITALIETGEPLEVCGPVVAAHNVQSLIVPGHRRSWLTKWWPRMAAADWVNALGCDVEIVEE